VLEGDAIKLTSKKVSSISGDARRILDICRFVVRSSLFLDRPSVTLV
jgi:Cdc6-like AAA superfamily ATPase